MAREHGDRFNFKICWNLIHNTIIVVMSSTHLHNSRAHDASLAQWYTVTVVGLTIGSSNRLAQPHYASCVLRARTNYPYYTLYYIIRHLPCFDDLQGSVTWSAVRWWWVEWSGRSTLVLSLARGSLIELSLLSRPPYHLSFAYFMDPQI